MAAPNLPPLPRRKALPPAPVAVSPPATVAVAPPPPPPQKAAPAPAAAADSDYVPQNPGFYFHAVAVIRSALVPNIQHEADGVAAEKAARHCAALLDSGATPQNYKAPKIAKLMHAILSSEVLAAAGSNSEPGKILPFAQNAVSAHHNSPHSAQSMGSDGRYTGYAVDSGAARTVPLYPGIMNEDQKRRETARLEAIAKENGGRIPTREEAASLNREELARFLDISEAVRATALECTCTHLSQRQHVTGGGNTETAALDIAVYELDQVIRIFSDGGLPTTSIDTMPEEERAELGIYGYPWPVFTLAADIAAREQDIALVNEGELPSAPPESTKDSEE